MTYKKPVHDYRSKDSLQSGNPKKKVMGYELMEDFEAIAREIDKLEGGLAGEFVEKTGDVMTGPLTTPKLTATEIVAGKVSASTFHGDGEEITGIITDQLADVNSEDAERDDLLIFNGSVWEAGSLPFVETSLTFKGGLDLTDSSLYPTEISDGDLYVASEDGVVASEWTGIAGASVYTGNFVGWADSKMRWFLLGDLSSSAVTKVGAGEGIDVDDSVPAEPVVSIDRDEVDTWYADLGDFNDLTVEVENITNIGPLVEEAPEDGLIYGRSDASWVEVTSGGGGGSSLWEQNGDDIYYNDGNVGIGTDSPNISGGGAASTSLTLSASASNGNGILELQGTRAAGSVVSYVRSFNNNGATPITDIVSYSGATSPDTTGELAFHTSNAERMRIDALGNVGIGDSSPRSFGTGIPTLSFKGTSAGSPTRAGAISFESYSGTQGLATIYSAAGAIDFYTGPSTTDSFRMRLDSSGNLLVGSSSAVGGSTAASVQITHTASNNGLTVKNVGNARYYTHAVETVSGNYALLNDANVGVTLANGASTWSAFSDETLKENISDIGPVLDTIKDFQCVNYSLKATESEADDKVGFIAQDWEHTFPNVVTKNDEGTLSMKYTETIPVLLKAIQEQQALIEALTAKVEALENA